MFFTLRNEPTTTGPTGKLESWFQILVYIIFFSIFISSCNKNNSKEETSCNGTPLIIKNNSYDNFKDIGLTPQKHPYYSQAAVAYADFNQDGLIDIFTTKLTYLPPTTPEEATDSRFEFYIQNCNGEFEKNENYLVSNNDTCIHPRKALVNDFNNDNLPDIFVICHGYDKSPFPGEKNKVVISNSAGSYNVIDASSDISFFHGGSSYDYDKDGYKDVLLVDATIPLIFFKNNGDGSFQNDGSSRSPTVIANKAYYTIELIDINNDSYLDLFIGGHEWQNNANTQIFINPGTDNFSNVTPDNISSVSNEGVVLDFTVTKKESSTYIWVLRTSGGDGTFYKSRTIQKVSWPSLTLSTLIIDRNLRWIPWIIPSVIDGKNVITSDNQDFYFTLEY
jgi:hypothetical protein